MKSIFKKIIRLDFVLILIFISCKGEIIEKTNDDKAINSYPIIVKESDTLKTGVPIVLNGKKILLNENYVENIKLKKPPKEFTVRNNQNIAGKPKVIILNNTIPIITLGENNIPLPKDTILVGINKPVVNPKPIEAKDPLYRDSATLDIKWMSVDQGLNSSSTLYTYEDSRNNIWVGYFGGGVSRFDGAEYHHYTTKQGLSSDYVWSIFEDSNKNLWFSHLYGGVTKYNGKTFTQYSEGTGFLNNDVSSAMEDSKGNIWFVTAKGVVKYDGQHFTNYTKENGLVEDFVISVAEDSEGNMWFGTLNSGLSKYDGKTFTSYTTKDGLPDDRIIYIKEDSKQNLWIATNKGGVCKLVGNTLSIYTTKEGLANNKVMCIREDDGNNIWFATYGGGISRFDGNSFYNISKEDGLPHNDVRNLLIDSKNNIWGATEGVGIFKFNPNSFKSYLERESIAFENIHTIFKDKKGNLWFGTESHGLLKYDGLKFTHYLVNNELGIYIINAIEEDSKGNIWIGTLYNGLYKFNGEIFTHYKEESGVGDNTIWSIFEDSKKNLWIATNKGGVSMFNGEYFIKYNTSNGFSSNNITSFLEDKKGNLWIGTNEGGVCKYNYKTFTFYSEKEGLSNNVVWEVLEDNKGDLWFGTHKGISHFNGDEFTNYSENDGLSNNSIYGLVEDNQENIWVSTSKGLNYLIKESNSLLISNFYKNDGLKSSFFHATSIEIDNENNLWLGNSNSLAKLNLNNFSSKPYIPSLQLNTVLVNENYIDYNSLFNNDTKSSEFLDKIKKSFTSIEDFHNYPKTLSLPYNFNHLNFKFSATEWSAPQDINYSYKVEGLDKQWSIPNTNNHADYRNIPPGNYTFMVKTCGKYGKWSNPLKYSFTINSPWWLTIWAMVGYVLFTVFLIIICFKWYTFRLKKQQVTLEKIVEERTATIVLQKEALSKVNKDLEQERNKMELKALLNQINPHFVFNTLNSIQQFIIANNVKTSLDYFNKFGKLIRSSLEHSEMKFVSIQEEILVIQNYVDLENLKFSEPVNLSFETNDIEIFNINISPMFIQPIVENAIIHGLSKKKKNRQINIEFREFDTYLLCSVFDNGFGRINTKSEKNKNSGLVITQKRLESVWTSNIKNSKIIIKDLKKPTGTIFIIKLPKEI